MRRDGAGLIATLLVATAFAPSLARSGGQFEPYVWSDAKVLKEAVVAGLALAAVSPDLVREERTAEHMSRILNSVMLFHRMPGNAAADELASLAAYSMGAETSESFRCLVIWKGKPARSAMARLLSSQANECKVRVDQAIRSGAPPALATMCAAEALYRHRLESLIQAIDRGEKCFIAR